MIFDMLTGAEETTTAPFTDYPINPIDRKILRTLASRMAELAARPLEQEKKDLWLAHNDLESTRPLVHCDPEGGWSEILPAKSLHCQGDLARRWELFLRKELFWGESMRDDKVIEAFFDIPYCAVESDWGLIETRIGGQDKGSYIWLAPLKEYQDIDKLRAPQIRVDYEKTRQLLEQAEGIFRDVLQVRLKGIWWWSFGLTITLSKLRGLKQVMIDMYDHPEDLHKLMAFLRDATLREVDFLEQNGLLNLNNDNTPVGSGGFGWTKQLPHKDFDGLQVRTLDLWGFAESQETSGISPRMFAEFVFPYQLPLLPRFGLNCYGCCEALNKRWDSIKKIPNLRRVSVSPWADAKDMAEKLQADYIYSLKPHPGFLAVSPIDEESIRKNLRETLRITKVNHCQVEIIMKDNHTLAGHPENAVRWCQIAKEEACSI